MKQRGFTTIELMIIIGAAFSALGWVMNIVKILGMNNVFVAEGIIRIVGIFMVPLGVVMGYL